MKKARIDTPLGIAELTGDTNGLASIKVLDEGEVSSEIPEEEQKEMGLSDGLIRFSIGLDNDIDRTYRMMKDCMKEVEIL